MKKIFESPKLEMSEFVVAARLNGSGIIGIAHDNGQNSVCSKVASQGQPACTDPSFRNSGNTTKSC